MADLSPNLLKKRLDPVPFGELPLWHGLVSYSRSSDKIRTATSLKAWFLPSSLLGARPFVR